jgi:hypothetical protein
VFYLLFIGYLIAFAWLVTKVPAIKKTGISPKSLMALFVLKVVIGCFFGYISRYYYGDNNDTWMYFNEGCLETDLILQKPKEFLTNIFHNEYKDGVFTFFQSAQSFWHSFKTNLIIKFIAILNVFSIKNYWINIIFFNWLFFFGFAYFYRMLKEHMHAHKLTSIALSFLTPSFLLFTSGFNKEAMVFACLSYIIFLVVNWMCKVVIRREQVFICFALGILLFVIRDFVFVALIPALLCFVLTTKLKWNPWLTFTLGYFILGIAFFAIGNIIPALNFPEFIIKKQIEFSQMNSGSLIPINQLNNSVNSFAEAAPRSLYNTLLKPHLADAIDYRYLLFAIELIVYYTLIIIGLFFRKHKSNLSLQLFFIFFSISILLVIGLIVPNVGAIVRYRSIYFPFLLSPILAVVDWSRLFSWIKIVKPIL